MKFQEQIDFLDKWLETRPHRERIMLLLMGAFLITFFWYVLLEKPLRARQTELQKQLHLLVPEIAVLNNEATMILKESVANASQQKSNAAQLKTVNLASNGDMDNLVTAILSPAENIKLTGLKSTPTPPNPIKSPAPNTPAKPAEVVEDGSLTISFQGAYFDTIAYLHGLEKLPWCLSWDSLEYKVVNYPNANVTINLHLVKAG